MTEETPAEYGLVMPFVACQSKGGPYDDQAFVAGYQAGRVDRELAVSRAIGVNVLQATVYTDLIPQIDLLAMRHGFTMEVMTCDPPAEEWSVIVFDSPLTVDEAHP